MHMCTPVLCSCSLQLKRACCARGSAASELDEVPAGSRLEWHPGATPLAMLLVARARTSAALVLVLAVLSLGDAAAAAAAATFAPMKPNIVFVVVDDMGYHNIRAPPLHRNSEISSPMLQRFAAEGITLSSYYAYKYCGPSRASLLSGRFPGHGISEGMFSSASPRAYNGNLTLLPAKLRTAGYRTHGLGKWHLGYFKRQFLPTSRGFLTWLGYLGGAEDHFTQATGDSCAGSGHVVGTDLWADYGNASQPAGGDNALGTNGTYSGYIYSRRAGFTTGLYI
eukprot:SAG11_NODE_2167_length_3725_cov_4.938224_2_plen_281_part_00